MATNFYDVLGVSRSASDADVRDAYRRKVKTTHPDAGGSAEAFREVQEAYETLATAHKRSLYDAWLENSVRQPSASRATGLADDMTVAVFFHQLDTLRAQAIKQLIIGLLWAGGALGLTLVTYASAKNGGGHYVILWGPIVFGAWRAIRSISMMVKVANIRRVVEAGIRNGTL